MLPWIRTELSKHRVRIGSPAARAGPAPTRSERWISLTMCWLQAAHRELSVADDFTLKCLALEVEQEATIWEFRAVHNQQLRIVSIDQIRGAVLYREDPTLYLLIQLTHELYELSVAWRDFQRRLHMEEYL
jgi:hypothetical protein